MIQEYMEVTLIGIEIKNISKVLNLLKFDESKIKTSRFYNTVYDYEFEYNSQINYYNYFSAGNTFTIYIDQIYCGLNINDVFIIASGNKKSVDIEFNFNKEYISHIDIITEYLCNQFRDINYGEIRIGVTDENTLIATINSNC